MSEPEFAVPSKDAKAAEIAAAVIRDRLGGRLPGLAVILGSGLGPVADGLQDRIDIPYGDIPGFPKLGVSGHAGQLCVGRLDGREVAVLAGRLHHYEGQSLFPMATMTRALKQAGSHTLLVTNAAGGLSPDIGAGRLMMLIDHINWAGINPLVGPNDETIGPRFPDMTEAYDPDLRAALRRAADQVKVDLAEGVFGFYGGPNFETPAEIRALRALGADAVGMSVVPEVLIARHCGLRIAAVSAITNQAAGMVAGAALSHAETLARGTELAGEMARLLSAFLAEMQQGLAC